MAVGGDAKVEPNCKLKCDSLDYGIRVRISELSKLPATEALTCAWSRSSPENLVQTHCKEKREHFKSRKASQ